MNPNQKHFNKKKKKKKKGKRTSNLPPPSAPHRSSGFTSRLRHFPPPPSRLPLARKAAVQRERGGRGGGMCGAKQSGILGGVCLYRGEIVPHCGCGEEKFCPTSACLRVAFMAVIFCVVLLYFVMSNEKYGATPFYSSFFSPPRSVM